MKGYAKLSGFVLGSLVVFGFTIAAYHFNWLPVKTVEFISPTENTGSQFTRIEKQLKNMASVYYGQSLFQVNIKELARQIEAQRPIKKAHVVRRFPDKLRVEVVLHRPVAVLLTGKNKFFPVSRTGEILNEVKVSHLPDLPIVRGRAIEKNKDAMAGAIDLILKLPPEGRFSERGISEVYKSAKNGYVAVLKTTGTEVLLGEKDFLTRSRQVSKVLKYMDDERLKGRVVDARFGNKVVVKLY